MTGKLAKSENSAAANGGIPKRRAQPMVDPDLDIPGKAAMPCAIPIKKPVWEWVWFHFLLNLF